MILNIFNSRTGEQVVYGRESLVASVGSPLQTITVTGLNLRCLPIQVRVWLEKPSGGPSIFPTLVKGSPTLDGFVVELSAILDVSGFDLCFDII